jgi:hypothetical protein
MAILAWFLVPETKGLSLERMDELFGASSLQGVEDLGVAAQHAKEDLEKEGGSVSQYENTGPSNSVGEYGHGQRHF